MGLTASETWSDCVVINPSGRVEWDDVKARVDIAIVATNLLGPAAKQRGRRLYSSCPFHDDHDPSFFVDKTRKTWCCFPCGIHGDAAELVKRINRVAFPDAVRYLAELAGVIAPSPDTLPKPKTPPRGSSWSPDSLPSDSENLSPTPPQGVEVSGLPRDEAIALVTESIPRLWGRGGEFALAYLHGRGLTDETMKVVRLGWTPRVMVPTKEGDRSFPFSGVVIPWFDGNRLTRVKIRRLGSKGSQSTLKRSPIVRSSIPIQTSSSLDCL